jgi:hypothetical protein
MVISPCETPLGERGFPENHRVAAAADAELIASTSKGGEKKPLSEFQFDAAGNRHGLPCGTCPHVLQAQKERETQRRM